VPAAPIVVYGASGYTGRLVVAEARRRGLDLVLSGRDGTKLRALARAGETARAAALDDRDALRHAFAGAAAVINCAGPFTRYGEPVLRAAIDTGVHYVDTTGEQGWIRRVFERHDDAARAAEVAAIPAVGFDYVPGDLICRLVADGLEPLDELVLAYGVQGFGATRGTMHSALEAVRAEGPRRPRRQSFTFPEPLGRQVMADYPCGEVVTVPRHTRVRTLTPLITATAFAPSPALAGAVPFVLPGLALALRTPAKALLDLAIDRLPEGPSEEDRRGARWTIAAVARGADGATRRGVVRGADVYGLTAVTAVHSAALLAAPGFDRSGALSPASAFDPAAFLEALGDHGVSHELDRAPAGAAS